jgi:NAD(P)-dependent dehydrogenase (short-subunit alcohol dehydrogenase family)
LDNLPSMTHGSSAGLAAIPMASAYAVSKTALYRLRENLGAETRGHGVAVFAINPGLVRTALTESALSWGEPSVEKWFTDAFSNQEDAPRARRQPWSSTSPREQPTSFPPRHPRARAAPVTVVPGLLRQLYSWAADLVPWTLLAAARILGW